MCTGILAGASLYNAMHVHVPVKAHYLKRENNDSGKLSTDKSINTSLFSSDVANKVQFLMPIWKKSHQSKINILNEDKREESYP